MILIIELIERLDRLPSSYLLDWLEFKEEKMDKVFVRHTVDDYAKWLNVFNSVEGMRKNAGEKSYFIYTTDDNPKDVIGEFEWDNLNNAKSFFNSEDLKQKMAEAGVNMQPEIFFCHPKTSGH